MAQEFDPAAYEVLVADDAASEETRRQVLSWSDGRAPRLRYIPVTRVHGPAAARNAGWRAAAGEIVAFTDDDCVPLLDWLSRGAASMEDESLAAVWGRLIMPLPADPTDYELNAAELSRSVFVTANCFCRRGALAAVGGFDERFSMAWREDSDLMFSLLEHEGRIAPAPGAVVVHPIRPAPWGVSVSQQRKSQFEALLYKKHPRLYNEHVSPGRPWHYYGILAAAALGLAGAAGGRRGRAFLGAAAWGFLTGRFCAKRLARTSRRPSHLLEMAVTSAVIPPLSVFWRVSGAVKYRVLFA
jgi:glycosyltransferase involved in cell wall biosynthesis